MCLYFKWSMISCLVIWHLTHSERWGHFVYIELGLWWMAGWYNWFQNSTDHSHAWKSQWGYFCVFVEVYLWQRFSRGLESNQRLVSKVLGASALLQSSPAAAGYLEELSSEEERQSKSSCQGFDVWHSFVSECNTEHKQYCTLRGGETFEVLLIYTKTFAKSFDIWPQPSFTTQQTILMSVKNNL